MSSYLESSYVDYVRSFDQSKFPHNKVKVFEEPQLVEFGRLEKICSGGGGFPRPFLKNDMIYVFVGEFGKGTYIRSYDRSLHFTGFEKILIPCEGRRLGDHDVTFDGKYLYHFPTGPTHPDYKKPRERGFGILYKYDTDEFNLISIGHYNVSKNERITDQNIAIIQDRVYVGSEYREKGDLWIRNRSRELQNIPLNPEVARATHLRIFDKNLNFIEERDLVANIEGAVIPHQYWSMGASQLYAKDYYCVVVHSPIGNVSHFDHGESIGARQIFILRFDDDFNFVDSKGPLSDTRYDNYWCTGSWYEDGRYYISYICRRKGCVPGPPGPAEGQPRPKPREQEPGTPRRRQEEFRQRSEPLRPTEPSEGNLRLGIFDEQFNELETVNVTPSGGGLPGICKADNKLYVSFKIGGSFIQEITLKD